MLKFRAECFEAYGLNKFRNFLKNPNNDDSLIEFEYKDDLYDLCTAIEDSCPMENCAIFILFLNDSMTAVVNDPEREELVSLLDLPNFNIDFFARIDADLMLDCYGLMIETRPGMFKIIEV